MTLFGRDDIRDTLTQALLHRGEPWVLTLIGRGGMGKTSVADAAVQAVIGQLYPTTGYLSFEQLVYYEDIIWWSVSGDGGRQPTLTLTHIVDELALHLTIRADAAHPQQVRQVLKDDPYLVVIDNLHTALAPEILAQLADWANPSKFLLISRVDLPMRPTLQRWTLADLTLAEATALVQHHAQAFDLATFLDRLGEYMPAIYELVGGNPLALKQLVSLLHRRPLGFLLDDLSRQQTRQVRAMFERIMQHTWDALSPEARQLLTTLFVVDEVGGQAEQLIFVSRLGVEAFWSAVDELFFHVLLEKRGTFEQPRYGIHNLTRTFLKRHFEAIPIVQTNMTYWQQWQDTHAFYTEYPNLRRAATLGLTFPPTRAAGIQLIEHVFPLIEQHGVWSTWLPLLEQARTHCQESKRLFILLTQQGELLRLNRQLESALAVHQEALALARTLDDSLLVARALFQLSEDHRLARNYEQAERDAQEALSLLEELGEAETGVDRAAVWNALGLIALEQGEADRAEEYLAQALVYSRQANPPALLGRTLFNYGMALQNQQKFSTAQEAYREARQQLSQTDSVLDKSRVYNHLGILAFVQEQYQEAEACFQQAWSGGVQRSGDRFTQAALLHNLGNAILKQGGRWAEAEVFLRQAIPLWQEIASKVNLANSYEALAETLVSQGQREAGCELYDQALALLQQEPETARVKKLLHEFREAREAQCG